MRFIVGTENRLLSAVAANVPYGFFLSEKKGTILVLHQAAARKIIEDLKQEEGFIDESIAAMLLKKVEEHGLLEDQTAVYQAVKAYGDEWKAKESMPVEFRFCECGTPIKHGFIWHNEKRVSLPIAELETALGECGRLCKDLPAPTQLMAHIFSQIMDAGIPEQIKLPLPEDEEMEEMEQRMQELLGRGNSLLGSLPLGLMLGGDPTEIAGEPGFLGRIFGLGRKKQPSIRHTTVTIVLRGLPEAQPNNETPAEDEDAATEEDEGFDLEPSDEEPAEPTASEKPAEEEAGSAPAKASVDEER